MISPTHPSLPDQLRLYVIADIHGHLDILKRLMRLIETDAAGAAADTVGFVFLGDYIDRGPDSKNVIEYLRTLPERMHRVFLRGNHDNTFLNLMNGTFRRATDQFSPGIETTLASYGVSPALATMDKLDELRQALAEKVPESHKLFFAATRHRYTCGDYYFVHAGVRPGVPLDQQTDKDHMWIREEFLNSTEPHGKIVIHGHTISEQPEVRHNRIGIDTGAFATSRLTCLVLEGSTRRFLST